MAEFDEVKDLYVVRIKRDDEKNEYVYLYFNTQYNQLTMKPRYVSEICSHLGNATKFETKDEAEDYVARDCNYEIPTGKCEIIKIDDIIHEKEKHADDESNKILANAWVHTDDENKLKMIEAKIQQNGVKAVVEFIDNLAKGFQLFVEEAKIKNESDDVTEEEE